jgi:hypothetical protein
MKNLPLTILITLLSSVQLTACSDDDANKPKTAKTAPATTEEAKPAEAAAPATTEGAKPAEGGKKTNPEGDCT